MPILLKGCGRFVARMALAACGLALGDEAAPAQQLSIAGTVRDATGVVPGATVTLRSGNAVPRSIATDSAGRYVFDGLAAGYYEMSFFKAGFEPVTRTMTLGPNTGPLDVVLAVGAASTSVTVTDVAGKATASRMEIPNADLPAQVSVIPEEALREQGTNDLVTALRNASGVQAQRFYGVYEYYTVRGFHQGDVLLVDGMRLEGNRFNTQLNNVESVEVLKGPSSILYGGQALSGAINLIRKKPQGTRAYDFGYKGGRFNSHQVFGGATGPLIGNSLLYRADVSFDHADGWRGAGANRFNATPALTWLMSERARVTVHQAFHRDDFNGDGGLPLTLVNKPGFDLSRRFSTPYDFVHAHDSQTNVLFNATLSPNWEVRDGFFYRRANDRYFVTEGVFYTPGADAVDRYALYFFHHQRPLLNQADLVGRVQLLGMKHTVLAGYEYQDYYRFTDRTPDFGDFFPAPIRLDATQDPQGPFSFPTVQVDYFTNRIHAFYWQDQVDVTARLKINVGGRYDDFQRVFRTDLRDTDSGPFTRGSDKILNQTAYTYRAGAVYGLPASNQVYFNSASSFQPVRTLPANGAQLNPETGRSYEFGHRWQGMNGRLQTSLAFYKIERNNVVIARGMGRYDQAGQQTSKGIDLDVMGDAGHGVRVIANYGYTAPRFDNFFASNGTVNLSGKIPRFAQRHAANAWVSKLWDGGFHTAVGFRYLGPMFTNNDNSVRLGGWTTVAGSVGIRRSAWEWSLNAENLLNRNRYFFGSDYDDQVYPGAPINVFSAIRFRFKP